MGYEVVPDWVESELTIAKGVEVASVLCVSERHSRCSRQLETRCWKVIRDVLGSYKISALSNWRKIFEIITENGNLIVDGSGLFLIGKASDVQFCRLGQRWSLGSRSRFVCRRFRTGCRKP